jgi:hypothetical protein
MAHFANYLETLILRVQTCAVIVLFGNLPAISPKITDRTMTKAQEAQRSQYPENIDFRWSVLFYGGHPQSPDPIWLLRVRIVPMQCDRVEFLNDFNTGDRTAS